MAAANASPRAQRRAILESPLTELTGFYLTVDCRAAACRGERQFSIAELAASFKTATVGQVLAAMRCQRGCSGRVLAAWLETGPVANPKFRARRVALMGPEARE